MPRQMVLPLEALDAIPTSLEGTQEMSVFGVGCLHMPFQVFPCDEGGTTNAAYAESWAVPTLMVAAIGQRH